MNDDAQSWFARRTFHHRDFDLDDLARRKAEQDVTISVVLPARNEAPTVAGVVGAAVALRPALVDEVVVIDGGSADDTVALARAAGADVYGDDDLLADHGPALGKGDALWRSLTVTSGDLVAFVDTDIRNPHPRFVWALLGPLLTTPSVGFVKAFYDRPLQLAEQLYATGGGRVTELTARPLLNYFWPQLAGVVQPLSGEYAGRSELLRSLPFFTGYGVEIGLLVDILHHRGADAIAQVDLEARIHRNQSMQSLSRMAYGVTQVALQRAAEHGLTVAGRDGHAPYLQFERAAGRVEPRPADVTIVERPPVA